MTIVPFRAPLVTAADLAGVYEWAATFGWQVWHSPENDPVRVEAGQEAMIVERLDGARCGVTEGCQKGLLDAWRIAQSAGDGVLGRPTTWLAYQASAIRA